MFNYTTMEHSAYFRKQKTFSKNVNQNGEPIL